MLILLRKKKIVLITTRLHPFKPCILRSSRATAATSMIDAGAQLAVAPVALLRATKYVRV